MCRMCVMVSDHPMMLSDVVISPKYSILYQSYNSQMRFQPGSIDWSYHKSSLNGDGFGIGWYIKDSNKEKEGNENSTSNRTVALRKNRVASEPCIFLSPRPAWNDYNLISLSEKTASETIFAHVRAAATKGFNSEANCHPFRWGNLMFMHNGALGEWDRMRSIYVKNLGENELNYLLSQSVLDSVVIFVLIVHFLQKSPYDYHTPEQLRMAVANMLDYLHAISVLYEVNEGSTLNIALTNGDVTICTRHSIPSYKGGEIFFPSLFMSIGSKWVAVEKNNDDDSDDVLTPKAAISTSICKSESCSLLKGCPKKKKSATDNPELVNSVDYEMITEAKNPRNVVVISSEPLTENTRCWIPIEPGEIIVIDKGRSDGNLILQREAVIPSPWVLSKLSIPILNDWFHMIGRISSCTCRDPLFKETSSYSDAMKAAGLPPSKCAYGVYSNTIIQQTNRMSENRAPIHPKTIKNKASKIDTLDVSGRVGPFGKIGTSVFVTYQTSKSSNRVMILTASYDGQLSLISTEDSSLIGTASLTDIPTAIHAISYVDSKRKGLLILVGLSSCMLAVYFWEDNVQTTIDHEEQLRFITLLKFSPSLGACLSVAVSFNKGKRDDDLILCSPRLMSDSVDEMIPNSPHLSPSSQPTENTALKSSKDLLPDLLDMTTAETEKSVHLYLGFVSSRIIRIEFLSLIKTLLGTKIEQSPVKLHFTVVKPTDIENISPSKQFISGLQRKYILKCESADSFPLCPNFGYSVDLLHYTNEKRHVSSVDYLLALNNGYVLSLGCNGQILVWNTNGQSIGYAVTGKVHITSVAIDQAGCRLFTGSQDGYLRVWCLKYLTCIAEINIQNAPITAMAYNPTSSYLLATCCNDLFYVCCSTFSHEPIYTFLIKTCNLNARENTDRAVPSKTPCLATCTSIGYKDNQGIICIGTEDHFCNIYNVHNVELYNFGIKQCGSISFEDTNLTTGSSETNLNSAENSPQMKESGGGHIIEKRNMLCRINTQKGRVNFNTQRLLSMNYKISDILSHLVYFKSISGDPRYRADMRAAAEYLDKFMRAYGCQTRLSACQGKDGEYISDVVIGTIKGQVQKPTILFYGHYDVVPVNSSESQHHGHNNKPISKPENDISSPESCDLEEAQNWLTNPWSLSVNNGYYVGRGVNDNKGPIVAQLMAVFELKREYESRGKEFPLNVVFFFDGDEEQGSRGILDVIKRNEDLFEQVDCVICCNATAPSHDPTVITGMRGSIDFKIKVANGGIGNSGEGYRNFTGWHSGKHGGAVIEPSWVLNKLLDSLQNSHADVTIPGFYDDVICPRPDVAYDESPRQARIIFTNDQDIEDDVFDSQSDQPAEDDLQPPRNNSFVFERTPLSSASANSGTDKSVTLASKDPLSVQQECKDIASSVDPDMYNKLTYGATLLDKCMVMSTYRRLFRPSLSIMDVRTNMSQRNDTSRVIPSWAEALLNMRIVPNQKPLEIVENLKVHLSQVFRSLGADLSLHIKIERVNGWFDAYEGRDATFFIQLYQKVLESVFHKKAITGREGGTIPVLNEIAKYFSCAVLQIPMAQPGDNSHVENECIGVKHLELHKNALRLFLEQLVKNIRTTN